MQRLLLAVALTIAVAGPRQAAATARLLEFVDDLKPSIVIGSQCDFGSHRTPFFGPRP